MLALWKPLWAKHWCHLRVTEGIREAGRSLVAQTASSKKAS